MSDATGKGTSNRESDYEGKNIKNMYMYFYCIKTDQEFLLFPLLLTESKIYQAPLLILILQA